MLEKLETQSFATYIGNGVAIPHGMAEGSKYVKNTGISIIQVLAVLSGMKKGLYCGWNCC